MIDFPEIRAKFGMVEVAARYIPTLKKSGSEYVGLCPFHNDSKPSLTIYRGRDGVGRFRCFSCDAAGDVVGFVAMVENVDMGEAARRLTGDAIPRPGAFVPVELPPDESDCWVPIVPVPPDAPVYDPAATYNPKRAKVVRYQPVRQDAVLGAAGELLGYVVRLEFEDGVKVCPTITFCEGPGGVRCWATKRFARPTPMIGLDALAARPLDVVLSVSGEKCRMVGAAALPGFVVVTWIGGDPGVEYADVAPLAGRRLVVWPDADATGVAAMARLCERAGAADVRHIETAGLPAGFDVADLVESGIVGAKLVEWCKARVKPGAPAKPKPTAIAGEKNPPANSTTPGDQGSVREPGRKAAPVRALGIEAPQAQTTAPPERVSSGTVVAMRRPEPEPDLGIPPEYSEDALADQFSTKYADDLAYVSKWGRWMLWDGTRWTHDETLRTRDMARMVARGVASEAATRVDLGKKAGSIATKLSSAATISSIESLARSDRRHAVTAEQWDRDPWALNTPGGIVDLQTGTIRPARKDDYATKITRVAPGGACPTWLQFLHVATAGNAELIEFMRRMAGYCLTGSVREHALFFVYGTGGNGKGTFLNTLDWILNDYARAANMDMFVEQKFASHPTDVAGLMGARLVTAQETEEGKRWHESRLKAFTGGDPITARFMRQDEFTFMPQFKLVFAGNHKPQLRNVDEAIRRRLYLIPFTVTVPAAQRDPNLPAKLRAEAAGILQWCIDGCLDWQNSMLAPPDAVLATTEEYFGTQDVLGQFFEECVESDRYASIRVPDLYHRYTKWMEDMGEFVLPRRRFTLALANKSMQPVRRGGSMMLDGIRLKTRPMDQDDRPY